MPQIEPQAGAQRLLARGVYRPHALTHDGFPFLVAIAADGRKIAEMPIYPVSSESEVADLLWSRLDALDPD